MQARARRGTANEHGQDGIGGECARSQRAGVAAPACAGSESGNASAEFLKSCELAEASGVIVTIHTRARIDAIVREVRKVRPDVPIFSRARDGEHARHLYAVGVTDAVPETVEASLQLSEAALVGLGIPTGPVIASIHEQRDVFRHDLQQAAQTAGRTTTRSLRAKRPAE